MHLTEFDEVNDLVANPPALSAKDLANRIPRTLLLGYTIERSTWHVYLDADGVIHVLSYAKLSDTALQVFLHLTDGSDQLENRSFIPNKRLYPESCDAQFCRLLIERGVALPFASFEPELDAQRKSAYNGFAGAVL